MTQVIRSIKLLLVSVVLVSLVTPAIVFAQDETASMDAAATPEIGKQQSEYVYNPMGRRDPFSPLVQEVKKVRKTRPNRVRGPLEKFELSQFRLMAILVVKGSPRAMVKAPDGKSYTVKLADPIGKNDGVVTKIETKIIEVDSSGQRIEKSPDRIVVEESGIDSYTGKVVKDYSYIVM